MGLLDGLLGNVLGGLLNGSQGQSPLLQAALQLLQQNGGLTGMLDQLRQSGLGQQADSWVSTGKNLPISAEDLQRVVGSGAIADIAAKLGMSHGEASTGLAQALPQIIDQMTPQGSVPGNHGELIQQMLTAVMNRA
jgi:uncharacterized protein YidB (DUF937 family)